MRRHTDETGQPYEWFAPRPDGSPVQIRTPAVSATKLTAFFAQFDSSTVFRIQTARTAAVSTTQPVVGPRQLPEDAVGLDSPPTFELTSVAPEPRRLQFSLPTIEAVTVVDHTALPSLDTGDQQARGRRYRRLAAVAPGVLAAEPLAPLLTADSQSVRYDAVRVFDAVVADVPAAGLDAVDRLIDRLADEPPIALYTVRTLATLAEAFPEAVRKATPHVIDHLDADSTLRTAAATRFLLYLAEYDPAPVIDATPGLAALLTPTPTRARRQALGIVGLIAEAFPEEVRPLVPRLCSLLETDDDRYRVGSTAALGHVTAAYPDAATPVVPTLLDQLTAANAELRGNAVGILGDIARGFPMDVAPYTDEIVPLVDDDDPTVRSNTAGTLARVAADDPARIRRVSQPLIELLDDSWTRSRVHACWALGHSGAREAIDPLTDHRHTDPSDAVRQRAAWALAQID